MKWKIFQRMKFLFRHCKNADWNQQQLTDGSILANRKSANHPYCFLSNQKKVQILTFLHVICERNVSCPPPENRLQRYRERAWSQAIRGRYVYRSFFFSNHCIKQIDSMLPWVCSVIEPRRHQTVVKTSVTHSPAAHVPLLCCDHIFTSSGIPFWNTSNIFT